MSNQSIKDFLLTPIVAPSLADSNYAEGISDSFNNINNNFAKLLSTPFLQGADGKDFELYKQLLFVEGTPSIEDATLNDWSKSVLYSIYKLEETEFEEYNESLKNLLEQSSSLREFHDGLYEYSGSSATGLLVDFELNQFYPVGDVFSDDSLLDMPYIWTYITKDDKGNINSQFVAQYYRFLDKRIVELKSNTTINYDNLYFDEMSCFLKYNPSETIGEVGEFDRIYLTPTLHYNRDNGDWTWRVDGQDTGISARGIQGEPGAAGANCWYAITTPLVEDVENNIIETNVQSLDLTYILIPDGSELNYGKWYSIESDEAQGLDIKEGDLVYCLVPSATIESADDIQDATYSDLFMGLIRKYVPSESGELSVYKVLYNQQYSFTQYINQLSLEKLLSTIGEGDDVNAVQNRGLWISCEPHITDPQQLRTPVHMMYAHKNNSTAESTKFDLRFQKTDNTGKVESPSNTEWALGRVLFDNYIIHSSRVLLQEGAESKDIDSSEASQYLKGCVLGVYGNVIGGGSIAFKGAARTANITLPDFNRIYTKENSKEDVSRRHSIATNDFRLNQWTNTRGSNKTLIQSSVITERSYDAYTSSEGSGGYKPRYKSGVSIPHMSNERLVGHVIDGDKIMIGTSILLDSSVSSQSADDIRDAFRSMYRLSTSLMESADLGESFKIKTYPTSRTLSCGIWNDIDKTNHRKGTSLLTGSANYQITTNVDALTCRTALNTGKVTIGGVNKDINYQIRPTDNVSAAMTELFETYKISIRSQIEEWLNQRLPNCDIETYNGTIMAECDVQIEINDGSLFEITAKPGCSYVVYNPTFINMTYNGNSIIVDRRGGFSHDRDVTFGTPVGDDSSSMIEMLEKTFTAEASLNGTMGQSGNSIAIELEKINGEDKRSYASSCAISTVLNDNSINLAKFTLSAQGQTFPGQNAGWNDVRTTVGDVNMKIVLKGFKITIDNCTYSNAYDRMKYLICPKGIFMCDSEDGTDIWNHMKKVVWQDAKKSDFGA